jgi:hypothetical protein
MVFSVRLGSQARRFIALGVVIVLGLTWAALPYDHPVVLTVRWRQQQLAGALRPFSNAVAGPGTMLNMSDIGIIIHSAYDSRDRLTARLQTMDPSIGPGELLVVADYNSTNARSANSLLGEVPVYDVLAGLVDNSTRKEPRIRSYLKLKASLAFNATLEDIRDAQFVEGDELDGMKVCVRVRLCAG